MRRCMLVLILVWGFSFQPSWYGCFFVDFWLKSYIFSQIFLDNAGGGGYSMLAFCVNKESRKTHKNRFVFQIYNPAKSLK